MNGREITLFVDEYLSGRHIVVVRKVQALGGDLNLVVDRHDRSFPEVGWCSIATVN